MQEARQRPAERHQLGHHQGDRREEVVGGRHHRCPGQEPADVQAATSSVARCPDDSRTAPSPVDRSAAKAANTVAVETATAGVTMKIPGAAAHGPQGCHTLAASFDEGRSVRTEEGHIGAEPGLDRAARVLVELGIPQLERTVDGSGGIRGTAAQAGRDRNDLLQAAGDARSGRGTAGPAATDGRANRGDRSKDEIVRPARDRSPRTCSESAAP